MIQVALVEPDTIAYLYYNVEEVHEAPEKKALTTQSGATWGLGAISHKSGASTSYAAAGGTGSASRSATRARSRSRRARWASYAARSRADVSG